MNLNKLMKQGVNSIMKTAGRYYLGNKAGRKFLAETLPALKKSAGLRERQEAAGTHVPVFLIASVASRCNLSCAGCYARTGGICSDAACAVSSADIGSTDSTLADDTIAGAGVCVTDGTVVGAGVGVTDDTVVATAADGTITACDTSGASNTALPSHGTTQQDLSADEWNRVFTEASEMGVSFVLMAGGEPFMRQDVIAVAAQHKDIIFPIFTNGTMVDDTYLSLLEANRNLIPVVSIEGDAAQTDLRRGSGTYHLVERAMASFRENNMLFGVSITVTHDTLDEVLAESFVEDLRAKGCGLVVYVEYVPTEAGTEQLALSEEELVRLAAETERLRSRFEDTVFLSFPGDEEALGGCLASGRGFFHINPKGGAEPCPFSPYSQHNVRTASLKTVLESKYFSDLRDIATKAGPHTGGCTLFTREAEVRALCAQA